MDYLIQSKFFAFACAFAGLTFVAYGQFNQSHAPSPMQIEKIESDSKDESAIKPIPARFRNEKSSTTVNS